MTLTTDPAPPVVGDAAVCVTFHNVAGQPVDGAERGVEANMSHAGMMPVMADDAAGRAGSTASRSRGRWQVIGT